MKGLGRLWSWVNQGFGSIVVLGQSRVWVDCGLGSIKGLGRLWSWVNQGFGSIVVLGQSRVWVNCGFGSIKGLVDSGVICVHISLCLHHMVQLGLSLRHSRTSEWYDSGGAAAGGNIFISWTVGPGEYHKVGEMGRQGRDNPSVLRVIHVQDSCCCQHVSPWDYP